MSLDLFVDTSRKGITMATSDSTCIAEPSAKGETASAILDQLLSQIGKTLDDVTRVMVTLVPGSFSGLRTGVAFCQGLCFSKKRELYGVSTLHALECFSTCEPEKTAVVIRARKDYWYLRRRIDGIFKESFVSTEDTLAALKQSMPQCIVLDDAALQESSISDFVVTNNIATINEAEGKLPVWGVLFDKIKPSLIQEANYIQPSYFEKQG